VVVAFLRLGTKYNIHDLRKDAIERLEYEFPSSLAHMDDRQFDMINLHEEGIYGYVDAVNLARETNLLNILPVALWECINFAGGLDMILAGHERQDGSITRLSGEDQRICLSAWGRIVWLQNNTNYSWGSREFSGCENHLECAYRRLWLMADLGVRSAEPGCHSLFCQWDTTWEEHMCIPCAKQAKISHNVGRNYAWDRLPVMFDLPEWDQLVEN
jgi:hypothetical protein